LSTCRQPGQRRGPYAGVGLAGGAQRRDIVAEANGRECAGRDAAANADSTTLIDFRLPLIHTETVSIAME
jgi:hypothetical protein